MAPDNKMIALINRLIVFCFAFCFLLINGNVSGQSTISGIITNHDGVILDHIHVQLKSQGGTTLHDEGYTDENGYYSLDLPGGYGDAMYRVKLLAENGYALVHAPGLTSTPRSFWGEFTFSGTETRDIQVFANDADDGDGLWLAGEVYYIALWFNGESGITVMQAGVDYPTDAGNNKAYYLSNQIHIGRNVKSAIYHEYGHFLTENYASWISIPYYGGDGTDLSHYACGVQDCIVWPYFEGFAHLIGALSYIDIYGSLTNASPYSTRSSQYWIENPSILDGVQYVDDDGDVIYTCDDDYMTHPLYTESAVGGILYDLVDADDDGEIANIPFSTLWETATYYNNNYFNNPCINPEDKDHPITIINFWDAYRIIYPGPGANAGPVPYLWSAYANNYVDWDGAPPNKPVITSTSHPEGVWTTDMHVLIDIEDGEDDVSGVFYYEIVLDSDPTTIIVPTTNPSDTSGAATSYNKDYWKNSGEYYFHARSSDLSNQWDASTTTYGPILIDTENPYFSNYFPDGGQTYLISEDIEIIWEARDNHSGIQSVDINYIDNSNGINIPIGNGLPSHGNMLWGIDNSIPPTNTGVIEFLATDSVGHKSQFDAIGYIEIRAILELVDDSLEVGPGDLAFADFDNDDFDDLAYTGKYYASFLTGIKTSNGTSLVHHQTLDPLDEGSVSWGDYNGDGLLDLFTMGLNNGGTTESHFYYQDNFNAFNDQGTLGVPGMMLGDAETADMDADGDLDLILMGRWIGANTSHFFHGYEWDPASNLYTTHALGSQGLFNGELVLIDYDADGDKDIVFAAMTGSGTHTVGLLRNNGNWSFASEAIPLPIFANPKLNTGDFNNDGWPDISIMGSPVGTPSPGIVLINQNGTAWATDVNVQLGLKAGDLTFADIDNDGDMDLTVMGRGLSGLDTEFWVNRDLGADVHELLPVTPYNDASIAWGDLNNDSDLDLVVIGEPSAGVSSMTQYYNLTSPLWSNTTPNPPVNLNSFYDSNTGEFSFTWNPPALSQDKTPTQSFTYDLKVGTASGLDDIFTGAVPVANGNTGYGTFHKLKHGHPVCYWSVRTVDGGWQRSNWATIQMADTNALPPSAVDETNELPTDFALYQNYPNPFNPTTTIRYSIPELSYVSITVYDNLGKEIALLVGEEKPAGNYEIIFNAENLSSGVYFYRLITHQFVETKKLLLLK